MSRRAERSGSSRQSGGKRAALAELFKALLHKLMTGEIRVGELDISVLLDNTTHSKEAEQIGGRA